MKEGNLFDVFENPGSEYRGAPFWAWNGKLDSEELRRQIRMMHRMGLGGFFMHSRVGLNTAYLSDEWFNCINACVDEAEKLDMQAWLYDEDRWPSGAAGGLVTKNPQYRARQLVMTEFKAKKDLDKADNVLAYYVAETDAAGAVRAVRNVSEKNLPVKGTILRFHVREETPRSWYNGYTYLDTMNHEAVREFIRVTHKVYEKRLGKTLGERVPGIFTDEPNYEHVCANRGGCVSTPWTGKLPEVFQKRCGYDLLDHIPELFLDLDGVNISKARYHYVDCITYLFVDAFGRQIGEWCDRTGCRHTGHVLAEETPSSQTSVVGSAMRFYEHMQAPGMDILTEHRREYDTAKQVSSAARQFGRKWRLTETYGCTGWDFPFLGHKAIGDWQVALGINLRAQHLYWYTMKAEAKRDYPASIAHQSPWWELYSKVEDYFARLHSVLTKGEEVRDLLVIHPVESTWTLIKKDWQKDPMVAKLDSSLATLRDSLLNAHIDFDYGDEEILSRHGSVKKIGGTPTLVVAKARYRAVVVPPMITIRKTTLELLKKFRDAGGAVVFAGSIADHVDAERSSDARSLAASCVRTPASGAKLVKSVEKDCRRVSILDGKGKEIASALYLLREDDKFHYLFVCNSGHNADKDVSNGDINDPTMVRDRVRGFSAVEIRVKGNCVGDVIELEAETGKRYSVPVKAGKGEDISIRTSLEAVGSRLFLIPKKAVSGRFPKRPVFVDRKSRTLNPKQWEIRLSEENVLVLDRASFSIGSGSVQKPEEILRIDGLVRDALEIPRRGGAMVQPWARETVKNPRTVLVRLAYRFQVDSVPSGPLWLAIEEPKSFRIKLNGNPVVVDQECGWWCDLSLRRLPVDPASLRVGENVLELECEYPETHPGLEIVYLLGNFGVKFGKSGHSLTQPPCSLKVGDWVTQGLPFYSGAVSYRLPVTCAVKKGERAVLRIPEFRGSAIRIRLENKQAGIIAWPPYEIDVTDFLKDGKTTLEIDLFSHRRNSHGPFHHRDKWPHWTGPAQYVTTGDSWTDSMQLVPCGITGSPELVIRESVK